MTMVSVLLKQAVIAVVVYGFYRLLRLVYHECTSPLRLLRGPPSSNPIFGNMLDVWKAKDHLAVFREWVAKYGPTFKYQGFLRRTRVFTLDLKAINHVLMNSYLYQKPKDLLYNLEIVVGKGVLIVEEDAHKNQRRALNPAFGPIQIRELTPIFIENAIRLRDIWASKIKEGSGEARVDALSWLGRTALEVIGEAGFGYKFGALSEDPNHRDELSQAFATMFKVGRGVNLIALLRGPIPILRYFQTGMDVENSKAVEIMQRVGRKILEERRHEIMSTKTSTRKDLLSLLVRANNSNDIPENQRLTDEEVLAQIPTFIVAGHESTGTATTWVLYSISKDKSIQEKLRAELQTIDTDNPTMDELNSLPYLDAVVRETLRLFPAVATNSRVAMKDDIIPLDSPMTDRLGNEHHSIHVSKGQGVVIPIALINTSKQIWGEDALEFNPSRWNTVPEGVSDIPGLWGNILTFSGGPRGCIGFRFSLVEIKALLFTLVRSFDLDLAVPHEDIIAKSDVTLVTRPILRTDPGKSNQMPLIIRPLPLES